MLGSVEVLEMPPPGDLGPARFAVRYRDYTLAVPLCEARGGTSGFGSLRFNAFQFLTIRRYLVLMFCTLIALLIVTAVWM